MSAVRAGAPGKRRGTGNQPGLQQSQSRPLLTQFVAKQAIRISYVSEENYISHCKKSKNYFYSREWPESCIVYSCK